jgi:hypothetical protein
LKRGRLVKSKKFLLLVVLPIMSAREIYNFIRFFGKKFTDNPDLIEFGELPINSATRFCEGFLPNR